MKRKVTVSIGVSLLALAVLLMALPSPLPSADAKPLAAQSLSVTYTQTFDALANSGTDITWTNDSTLPSWYASRASYSANTGSSATGALYSYGSAGSTERALGSLASGGTGSIYYGVRFHNDTGVNVSGIVITYTGEQWRVVSNTQAPTQSLAFAYRIGAVVTDVVTGTWTNVNALNFVSPVTSTSPSPLDGNATANRRTISGTINLTLPPDQEIMLRWQDIDDSGTDYGLAIDDLTVSAIIPAADLVAGKTGPAVDSPGNTITYTLSLLNAGNIAATSTVITDVLPVEVTFVSYTTALPITFTQLSAQTLMWELGDIASGASGVITVEGTISASVSDGTSFTNTVTASTTAPEIKTTNNTAYATTVIRVSDLDVVKTGPATAAPGDTITYTVSLSNTGTLIAAATRVTDTLPTEVTFITYTTALTVNFAQPDAHTLVWDLGDVAAGANNLQITVRGTISASVAYGTLLTNTVTASTTAAEINTANNAAQATTLVGAADVAVVKSGPASVNTGDILTFTLTYSNDGNLPATGVVLVDQLPSAMSYVSDSLGSGVMSNGVITWNIGSLNGYASNSLVLTATALAGGDYQNRATISSADDVNPANNTSSITVTILGANPYVSKTGPSILIGGQVVSYTITYGNAGNQAAQVTITDTLPIGFTAAEIVTDTSGLNPIDGTNTRSWTTTIGANAQFSFTLAVTAPTSIANSTRVTNTIEITTTASGNSPIDDVSIASGTVYQFVPIATARAGSIGQIFAIEGQVTYMPGTYDPYGWAVQDGSGGIVVVYAPTATVALDDRVRIVATRNTVQGEEQLQNPVYYLQNLGPGPAVNPIPYSTGAVSAGTTEGWLVVITGTVSSLGACTGDYQFLINDGSGAATIFVDQDTGVNVCASGVANGDAIRVVGFSTQSNALYEVKPRRPADVAEYPRVLSVTPANNATGVPIATTVRATFNLTMTNVNTTTFSVQGSSGAISGTVKFDAATQTATFTPTTNLAYNTRYTATLKSVLTADNGLMLMPPQDYVWSFVTLQPAPQLAITKTVATVHSLVDLGEVVTYTLTLSNSGNGGATGVVMTDVLPTAVTFGGFVQQNSATFSSGTVSWSGSLNAGASAMIAFTTTVANNQALYSTDVTNTVQFTSSNGGSGSASSAFAIVKRYFTYLPLIKK